MVKVKTYLIEQMATYIAEAFSDSNDTPRVRALHRVLRNMEDSEVDGDPSRKSIRKPVPKRR